MPITVAAAQIEPVIGDPDANLRIARAALEDAANRGPQLIVLPECALTGYVYGAEITALPTNWPVGADIQPDVLTRARASENHVFIVAADRVGKERGLIDIHAR